MISQRLKEFIVLCETMNLPQAADQLYMTPSALSKRIHKLESEYQIKLYRKTGRGISLTKEGKQFLAFAQQMVDLDEGFKNGLAAQKQQETRRLTIGMGYRIFEEVIAFSQQHPDIEVVLNENFHSLEEVKQALGNQELDQVYLTETENMNSDFARQLLFKDRLALLVNINHPLAKASSVSLRSLKNESFIQMDPSSPDTIFMEAACNKSGFKPKIAARVNRGSTAALYVQKGLGVSVLLRHSAENLLNEQLKLIEISPCIFQNVYCYYKPPQKEASKLFFEELKTLFGQSQ